MLVHIKELFPAQKDVGFIGTDPVVGQFAYPAFNTQNLETTLGIVEAAEELGVPVIIQVSEGSIKYAGLSTMFEIMATVALRAKVPIALHMDHGKDMEQLKAGIQIGFSSAMLDHSSMDFDQNVKDTKEMVEFAHAEGAWVQGEIGKIRGSEDWISVSEDSSSLTDPEEAKRYVEATGVDTLACAVGTIHGMIKLTGDAHPKVDVPRIEQIFAATKKPIVLHGASGIDALTLSQAITAGVAIVNIDSDLRLAFAQSLRASVESDPKATDPRKIMGPVIARIKEVALQKLRDLRTQNVVRHV